LDRILTTSARSALYARYMLQNRYDSDLVPEIKQTFWPGRDEEDVKEEQMKAHPWQKILDKSGVPDFEVTIITITV
jgi:hypothetical protein